MNQKVRPIMDKKRKINRIRNHIHEANKFDQFTDKVKQLKIAKEFTDLHEDIEFNQISSELPLLKKIDYHSFIGYFVGYCLFNFFYWIDMLF